jgi:outer membrane protein OmpA-like peptidoglycan-associated protein
MNAYRISRLLPRALALGLSASLLAACAGSPERPPELVRLEAELSRLQSDSAVASHAAEELAEARQAVDLIARDQRRMNAELFDHNVYLASRLLRIAEAEGRAEAAGARLQQLGAERERLVAEARTAEAQRSRAEAERAQMTAQEALRAAERERTSAELARTEAAAARAELDAMQQALNDLSAKQTERGLVVTLGDVLFEVDRAELKPGAERNLNALVEALRKYEGTTVSIEGHTDSTGAAGYNLALSQRRAEAVQLYLAAQGIEPPRMVARGLGKDYPVASNDSSAGRQQNRRVEIVIQNLDTGTAAQVEPAPR